MTINIYLNGGGNAEQSLVLDEFFMSNENPEKIAFFAHAGAPEDFTFHFADEWLQGHHIFDGRAYTEEGLNFSDTSLERTTAVFLSGGNTFRLLEKIRASNAIDDILAYIESGRPFYGLSAGAIVLGKDIESASFPPECDPNESNIIDLGALNVLAGYNVACHYSEDVTPHLESAIAKDPSTRFIALPEDGGAHFNGTVLTSVGRSPIVVFTSSGKQELGRGESIKV